MQLAKQMPGTKHTEVGVIPADWDTPELQELTPDDATICYGIVQVRTHTPNGVPVLAIKNLNGDYQSGLHHAAIEVERPYIRSRVRAHDVLISVKGTTQELLSGKRRLPGFSGNWETKQVREVILKHFCGPSPTCQERNIENSEEWGVLKTTAITWENGWDWKKHKVLPKVFWNNPDIELRVGDVVVTKAGPRHRVGVSTWVNEVPKQIVVSGKMIGLRPDSSKANAMMLASAIASKAAQRHLDQRTTGMAESQVNFENNALLETPIQMPKIEEQSAIAAILSDMDAEITALEAKLTKARMLKQGMMQELLTGRVRLV